MNSASLSEVKTSSSKSPPTPATNTFVTNKLGASAHAAEASSSALGPSTASVSDSTLKTDSKTTEQKQSSMPKMQFRYPSSFMALLLMGFFIVALPLIAGLISNAFSIEKLSVQSQQAVYNATLATQNARQLSGLTSSMERAARFYAVAGDVDMVDSYQKSRETFQKLLNEFMSLPLAADMRANAEAIKDAENAVYVSLTTKSPSAALAKQIERDFVDLSARMESLTGLSNELVEREVGALRAAAAKSKSQVFWQLLAIIPSALLMIAGFTYLLARPVRELDAAINRLGEGKLSKRIQVSGPRDIELLGEQLDWLRQRLIALEDQKTRFFQHVSHELKTPLTALREGSELLTNGMVGPLSADQQDVAQILRQNSITLEKLIQDLLTYSQSQSADALTQKIALDLQPLQLRDLIDQVIIAHKITIVAKNLIVKRECDKTTVHGDAAKLGVVIDNLMSNAIKYSPVGGTVVVRLGKHRDSAVIEVLDNGPGIANEDRDKIFDPFYRSKTAVSSGAKGSGLGLAIVRDYVEMHHGTVAAIASVGARFRVILPRQPAEKEARMLAQSSVKK